MRTKEIQLTDADKDLLIADYAGQIEAINKSQAVIEFNMDGTVISANENFLNVMGYSLDEIQGKHHSMFVDPLLRDSDEYKRFWTSLNRGEYQQSEYKRIGKNGREVWIQASYNPIFDLDGKLLKVVKYATDVTQRKIQNADYAGQIDAINKSQAVIEFNMDGTVISANENFLNVLGYRLDEIQGKHHSMFVEASQRDSDEYKQFWISLNRGEYQRAEYKRIGKGGREVWIQASYNPIFDLNGKPVKVVKYATDVTQRKIQDADYAGQIEAISKSQAVIEFNMDGTIIAANENFLNVIGYRLDEIQGKHHSMFVDPAQRDSDEYKQFWSALNRGEYQRAEYKRIGKGGREIWIHGSYNPIFDLNDKPFKVVKYATDVTERVYNEMKIREQSRTIMEISTPAISMWEGIVVLPVVGVIDSIRAQQMMETILNKIADTACKVMILDIQGVPAVDTGVANHLIKIVKATRLMGCQAIISGISPAVAQTIVSLGIDMGVNTTAMLRDALETAFELIDCEVRSVKPSR